MTIDEIKDLITSNIQDAVVEIFTSDDNSNRHLHINMVVISDEFQGKRLLDQHRMVMDILNGPLQREIHAVKIKTMTKAQAQKLAGN